MRLGLLSWPPLIEDIASSENIFSFFLEHHQKQPVFIYKYQSIFVVISKFIDVYVNSNSWQFAGKG